MTSGFNCHSQPTSVIPENFLVIPAQAGISHHIFYQIPGQAGDDVVGYTVIPDTTLIISENFLVIPARPPWMTEVLEWQEHFPVNAGISHHIFYQIPDQAGDDDRAFQILHVIPSLTGNLLTFKPVFLQQ